jgi:hypothetical protein
MQPQRYVLLHQLCDTHFIWIALPNIPCLPSTLLPNKPPQPDPPSFAIVLFLAWMPSHAAHVHNTLSLSSTVEQKLSPRATAK